MVERTGRAGRREHEVQLAAMVPPSVRRAVRRRAEEEGTTVRTVLLRALKRAGIITIDEAELTDRRTGVRDADDARP
jgi:hypothetical protein